MPKQFDRVEKMEVSIDVGRHSFDLGALAWSRKERRAYFQFSEAFLDQKLAISPFRLRNELILQPAPNIPFDGLHGVFNDSLPDGWGRKLVDRRLRQMDFDYATLNPLDRLSLVGTRGMGALRYRPVSLFDHRKGDDVDLDWMSEQAALVERDDPTASVDALQDIQGGSGGVRPKVLVGYNVETGQLVQDRGAGLPSGFASWIVKFASIHDPAEIGPEEYAYSLMAKAAGIRMPETTLIPTQNGRRFFAARRFDRTAEGPKHAHTLSGLLNADHRIPSVDYGDLLKLTRILTRDEREVREVFRRMVFNVFAKNRDDHAKNHTFIMHEDGVWEASPAYDVTFSAGPGGEHNLMVGGEGRAPTAKHIMEEAAVSGIKSADAGKIVEEVRNAIEMWPVHAEAAGLSEARMSDLDYLINNRGPRPSGGISHEAGSSTSP